MERIPKTFGFISRGWDWDSKHARWLDEASVHHIPVHQSDLLAASLVSSWGASWLATERLSEICLGVEQNSGWSKVKPVLLSSETVVFLSFFYVKTPSSSDNSAAVATSTLIFLAAAAV